MQLSTIIMLITSLGFAPPLLWLWFWLKEDAHPEPRKEIIVVFLMGMSTVLVAFIVQAMFSWILVSVQNGFINFFDYISTKPLYLPFSQNMQIVLLAGFALIEELAKFGAAFITALRSKYYDEPIDAMIYAMTAALGFAALENALFISQITTNISEVLFVGAFRFAHAVLIHAATSAIIGASFAFSFCHPRRRAAEFILALLFATGIHTFYNILILQNATLAAPSFRASLIVVGGAIIALILFERARRLRTECGL